LASGTLLATRDGGELSIDDTAAPIRDSQSRLDGAVMVFRDISSRLQEEEAVHKAELQLRQSQRMESIGRLAGGVAHDLNNLMTVVIGCGDLLLKERPAIHRHHRLVKEMKDAGNRAVTLARQLVAFGRKTLLVPAVIDLNGFVRHIEALLRPLVGEGIAVRTTLQPDAGRVRVDPDQMEHVIVNLAINARSAMPDGGTLTLNTRRTKIDAANSENTPEVQPGRYMMLGVSDTGSGIEIEKKATVMRLFASMPAVSNPGFEPNP
jgi:two-component system cell cycle sensor histidine kinase/response regulator CckA